MTPQRGRMFALAMLLAASLPAACSGQGGGQSAAASAGAQAGDAGTVGKAATGETCRGVSRPGVPIYPGAVPPLDIFCGDTKDAVGVIWTDGLPTNAPTDAAGRKAALEQVAQRTVEGQSIARRMNCGPAEVLSGDGNVLFYSCILREGNWPQVVLRVGAGERIYQAEGLPSMLDLLSKGIEQLNGGAIYTDDTKAALARTATSLAGKGGNIGTADVVRYNQFMRLGRMYNSTRNFAASEDAFRSALEIETRIFGDNAQGVGEVLLELALAVSNEGRYDEAQALFQRAEPIVAKGNEGIRARFYAYQAFDAANQGKYKDGLADAQQSTALRRQQIDSAADAIGDVTDADPHINAKGELVHSLIVESALALKLGDTAQAQAAIDEALQIMARIRQLPLWWKPEALILLGKIEAASGNVVFAERNIRAGVELTERIFAKTAPTARAYMALGRFYAGEDYYAQSVAAYRLALPILVQDETARTQVMPDDLTPFLAAGTALGERDPNQRPKLQEDMFAAIQLMGSSVTDQAIAHASARLATTDPAIAQLIRDTQEAERARDSARLQLATEQSKPDDQRGRLIEEDLAKQVADATAKASTLQAQLQQAFPAYAKFAEPKTVDLATMQKRLEADEGFVTFVIGQQSGFAVVVRKNRFVAKQLEINEDILTRSVADLRKALTPRLGSLPDFDLRLSNALYKRLMGPIEGELAGVEHLIVAPVGALASLPMSLLVTSPPSAGAQYSYGSAQWLIRRVAVSEVPSVNAFIDLRIARAEAKPAPRPFLGVGNPTFTGAGGGAALDRLAINCRDRGPVPPELIRALAPLPETADEVRRVGQRLGADSNSILLGPAASEANLLRQPLGDYNVLYFATHGLLPGELRCDSEPGLALSPPAGGTAASANDDGMLDSSEVAKLKLNADLVVLSACNTAAGGGRLGGESLSGLAEAFFHAGARTLVVSHWQVSSNSTVQLMTGFFDRVGPKFRNGLAQSLREAQLSLAGAPQSAHPFYWAAFILMGDGGRPGAGAGLVSSGGAPTLSAWESGGAGKQ